MTMERYIPFHYKFRPGTDDLAYRVAGDTTWCGWSSSKHAVHTHVENLTCSGLKAAYFDLF